MNKKIIYLCICIFIYGYRFVSHGSLEHVTSPRSTLYEDNSMECQVPVYCYETPPQEPRYLIDNDTCQQSSADSRKNYWEPVAIQVCIGFFFVR